MHQIAKICIWIIVFYCNFVQAGQNLTQRHDVQTFINNMVKKHGFQKREIIAAFNDVKFQPQIIESMERPYEKKTWDVYKALFLTSERVQGGIDFWQANQKALAKAEQKYHVPAHIIVAIIGIETLYGKRQGNYRVLDALSTLAFDYPKRSEYFTKELEEFFLLCREHGVSPSEYMGSYAGAMGKPQFMPSSYRYYAANFSGDPKKDLMNDDEAVIASVANYFHQHGWNYQQGVVQPAKIVGTAYKRINTSYKKAVYSTSQLLAAGIKPITASFHVPKQAGLIELLTSQGTEYWLAYPNFYVITRYNSSPQYALAVYLLAQQLKNQWAETSQPKKYAFA